MKKEESNYNVFIYKLRKRDGTDFEYLKTQHILIKRYSNVIKDIKGICGFESKDLEGNEIIRGYSAKKSLGEQSIKYPNDMLRRNDQEIKDDLINQIIFFAEENGIKKRHLTKQF